MKNAPHVKAFLTVLFASYCFPLFSINDLYAQEHDDFAQFSCRPEYDFFSIRTLSLQTGQFYRARKDVAITQIPIGTAIETQQKQAGLYKLTDIANKPYTCQLNGRKFQAAITNFQPGGKSTMCGNVVSWTIDITLNNKSIYSFDAFDNRCLESKAHLISVQNTNLQDCLIADSLDSASNLSCVSPNIKLLN